MDVYILKLIIKCLMLSIYHIFHVNLHLGLWSLNYNQESLFFDISSLGKEKNYFSHEKYYLLI